MVATEKRPTADGMTERLDCWAWLLEYPTVAVHGLIDSALQRMRTLGSAGADDLARFQASITDQSLHQLQEHYTWSFDTNQECALEVGWHLYGETYQRGTFLVQIREALRVAGLAESDELPDHLTHVLQVLGRSEPEEATRLARLAVIPAVEKAAKGLAERDSLFLPVLRGIRAELLALAGLPPETPAEFSVPDRRPMTLNGPSPAGCSADAVGEPECGVFSSRAIDEEGRGQ